MKLRTRREKHFKHNLREMGVGPCEPVQAQESNKEPSSSTHGTHAQEQSRQESGPVTSTPSPPPKSGSRSKTHSSQKSANAAISPPQNLSLCRYCGSVYQPETPEASVPTEGSIKALGSVEARYGPKMARLCKQHRQRAEKLIQLLKHSFNSPYMDESQTNAAKAGPEDGKIMIQVSTSAADRPWEWLKRNRCRDDGEKARKVDKGSAGGEEARNAAPSPEPKISQVDGLLEDREGRLKHSDGATVTPGVASLQANEASVASQSLDLDLLWSYAFPHEPLEDKAKADVHDLGLPKWYVDLTTAPPVVPQESPQPTIRIRSLTRGEGRKTRRTSNPQVGAQHVRTPSAALAGSPKADGSTGRSIFCGSTQQARLERFQRDLKGLRARWMLIERH
ncbi:unnamed protein product [Durusdinium trenchii]|uniref:Uncharacterized protein n=1 Tax=Durusdinium trenchii TaxID=1381693 RepID=A0ABP0R4S1_9DINO